MIGKLLCKLGVHDNQVGGWNWKIDHPNPSSVWGRCVRCYEEWQLDN